MYIYILKHIHMKNIFYSLVYSIIKYWLNKSTIFYKNNLAKSTVITSFLLQRCALAVVAVKFMKYTVHIVSLMVIIHVILFNLQSRLK